jgi:archaellum component FlaC
MSGDGPAVDLPEPAAEWLSERAAEREVSEEAFLRSLVLAASAADEGGELDVSAEGTADPERVEELEAEVTELADEVDDLTTETEQLVDDVRERVLQVKRETDEKAPVDHDHPGLVDRMDALAARLDELDAEIEAADDDSAELREALWDLRTTVREGFGNYEEVLAYLTDETDDLADKTDTLARAVLDVRAGVRELRGESGAREALAAIKRRANREGIRRATCGGCEQSVDLGLLTEPSCPACGASFEELRPKQGLFGSHRLLTGQPPALAAGPNEETDLLADDTAIEAIADEEPRDGPEVDAATVDDAGPPPDDSDSDLLAPGESEDLLADGTDTNAGPNTTGDGDAPPAEAAGAGPEVVEEDTDDE